MNKSTRPSEPRQVPQEIRDGTPYWDFYEGPLQKRSWKVLTQGTNNRADFLLLVIDLVESATEGGEIAFSNSAHHVISRIAWPLMNMLDISIEELQEMELAVDKWLKKGGYPNWNERDVPKSLQHLCPGARPFWDNGPWSEDLREDQATKDYIAWESENGGPPKPRQGGTSSQRKTPQRPAETLEDLYANEGDDWGDDE